MSDYYGSATLEDWLAEEVFSVPHGSVPTQVVALFERWRSGVEHQIDTWMSSDEGDGRMSWRGWGRGFYAISDDETAVFDALAKQGREMLGGARYG